ncbi:glycosyltransferase family 10 domain-containing protein [Fontisphaera persica]|uniref:glycosyltransferase family 10 domain-containing protein n=1 Tax=Fontisphaera persica TaxID=2974023 RepID=UPI003CCE4D5E
MENSCEKYYFTEKFVNAVRAGCIPIYHPHSSVRNIFLKGARWVDPKDFNYSPKKTIAFALRQDINEYRKYNDAWLRSGMLDKLDHAKVIPLWLHPIFKEKFARDEKKK